MPSGAINADHAGQVMGEIVSQVRRVTDLINEISSSTMEQSGGIGQVNIAVSQLDQMTQQNAALDGPNGGVCFACVDFRSHSRSLITGPVQTRSPCGAHPGAPATTIRDGIAMTGGHGVGRGHGTSRSSVPVPDTAAATTSSQSSSVSRTASMQAPPGLAARPGADGASTSRSLPPRNSPPRPASPLAPSSGTEDDAGPRIFAPRPIRARDLMPLDAMGFLQLSTHFAELEVQVLAEADLGKKLSLLFESQDRVMSALEARLAAVAGGAAESLNDTALLRRALMSGTGASAAMQAQVAKFAAFANVTIDHPTSSEQTRKDVAERLAGMNDKLLEYVRRAASFHDLADSVAGKKDRFATFKTTIDREMRALAKPLAYKESVDGALLCACASVRVGLARMSLEGLPPEVDHALSVVREGYIALLELRARLQDAFPLAGPSDPRALSEPKELRATLKTISDAKDAFARAAAEHVAHATWPMALDIATAIGISSACYEKAVDVLHPQPSAPASAPERAGRSRRNRNRPAARPVAQEPVPGTSAERASNPRAASLQKSSRLLRGSRLSAEMLQSTGAELLALGRAANKDVSTLEAARAGREPTSIASQERTLLHNWFGDVDKLAQARAEIASLLDAHGADRDLSQRLVEIEGQIAGLRAAERRIDDTEMDSLKQHEEPKSKHLDRLLGLGQIAGVGAPTRLPSEGDQGDRGTLFELMIRPRPLSDGRRALPLYVHVHLQEPASDDEFRALSFDRFAAVHVKTDWQKNKGARWEQLQHAMGNTEARVHRGQLDEQVWNALRDAAGR